MAKSRAPKPEPHRLVFVDLETTGLNPDIHEIWELAILVDEIDQVGNARAIHGASFTAYPATQHLSGADSKALEIGRYYQRHPTFRSRRHPVDQTIPATDPGYLASLLAPRLDGAFLVGCTVHFDAAFLDRFLRNNGQAPTWNYHLIDATVYAAGAAGLRPPWKSSVVAKHYGVKLAKGEEHCALNDAKLAQRLYYAAQAREA